MATQNTKPQENAKTEEAEKPKANDTVKVFSAKNDSARLINVLGKSLAPGQSANFDDTPENRATFKGVDGLIVGKAADAEEGELSQSEKDDAEAIAKATSNDTNKTASATGAGWSTK